MDILVVGASNIFVRRMLPALLASPLVDRIHVASRRADVELPIPDDRRGRVFHGYDAAFAAPPAELVYVTLPNSLHAPWVRTALEAGCHVIVDKPAVLTLGEAEGLVALASARGRCLAEATVWQYHPQVDAVQALLAAEGEAPLSIQSTFSFPRPAAGNFRNDAALGGGAFWDLEAYAITPGRVLFGGEPEEVWCRILARDPDTGLDTAFALSMRYPGGQVLQGFFGFGAAYRNTMTVLGRRSMATLEPAFTSLRDARLTLRVKVGDTAESRDIAPADTFREFTERVIGSITRGAWAEWPAALLQDATVAHRAALSAGIL